MINSIEDAEVLRFYPNNIDKKKFREAGYSKISKEIAICIDTIKEPFVIHCPECNEWVAAISEYCLSWDGPIRSVAKIYFHKNYNNANQIIICESCKNRFKLLIESCPE